MGFKRGMLRLHLNTISSYFILIGYTNSIGLKNGGMCMKTRILFFTGAIMAFIAVILLLIGGLIAISDTFNASEALEDEDEKDYIDSYKGAQGGGLLYQIGAFIGTIGINCIGLGFLFKIYKAISAGIRTLLIIGNAILFIGIILALVGIIIGYNASIDGIESETIEDLIDANDTDGYSMIIRMIGGIFQFFGIGFLGLSGALILIMKRKKQKSQLNDYPPEPPKNNITVSIPSQPEDMKPQVPRPPKGYEGEFPPPY